MSLPVWLLFLLAGVANANEPCCVDQDIAAAFMPHAHYSRDWPDAFPVDIDSPALEFIGSNVNRAGMQALVGWKSALTPQDARALIASALRNENWRLIPEAARRSALRENGFVPHTPPEAQTYVQFCRGRDGQLTLAARSTDIGTVVTLAHFRHSGSSSCESTIAMQTDARMYSGGLIRYLPALQLPESLEASPYAGMGGGGSQDAHASITVDGGFSTDELMTSFSRQMVEQGWRMDADFRGTATVGHTWLRDVEGLSLSCIVTAFKSADDNVHLRMHLEPL